MTKEYRAKVFKSGNSLALRLPKALGLIEGVEMLVREDARGFTFEPVDAPRTTIDVSGFAGKLPGFTPAPREDFEARPSAITRRKALAGG